jgi:hypothetical protein
MEDGTAHVPADSGQRPGSPRGGRAVVAPGDDERPPAAWAPAVLIAHAVLLLVAVVAGTVLTALGVEAYHHEGGEWVGTPAVVTLFALAVAVVIVVLVIRRVGRRHPGRLDYWLAGTACWAVVPVAWLTAAVASRVPEGAALAAVYAVGTPFGWVVLVPALVAGGMWTAALARLNS